MNTKNSYLNKKQKRNCQNKEGLKTRCSMLAIIKAYNQKVQTIPFRKNLPPRMENTLTH